MRISGEQLEQTWGVESFGKAPQPVGKRRVSDGDLLDEIHHQIEIRSGVVIHSFRGCARADNSPG